jgi:hypothetical protein
MCDIVEDMPGWMAEMIELSFEVKAAQAKAPAQKPADTGGLADLATDETGEEDIPF